MNFSVKTFPLFAAFWFHCLNIKVNRSSPIESVTFGASVVFVFVQMWHFSPSVIMFSMMTKLATKTSLKGKSDKLFCRPSENADTVQSFSSGPRSISRTFADVTSSADRFYWTPSVFNGQAVTRHLIGSIDVVVLGEAVESDLEQLKHGDREGNWIVISWWRAFKQSVVGYMRFIAPEIASTQTP